MATKVVNKTIIKQKHATYVKDFVLTLGPWMTQGRLLSIVKSKTKQGVTFNLITPEGNSVQRRYIDEVTGKVYEEADLDKVPVLPDADEVEVFDAEDIKAAKQSDLPKNVFDVTVHRASEVSTQLFPSVHSAYIFEPYTENPKNVQAYKMLRAALSNDQFAMIGVCNVKGNEGLYRLGLWRGQIVMFRQAYPADINDHDVVDADVNPAVAEKLSGLLDTMASEFDATEYRNKINEKVLAFLATGSLDKPRVTVTSEDDAMLAELEALGL